MSNEYPEYHTACYEGNYKKIKEFSDKGIYFANAIIWNLAGTANLEFIKLLIKTGVDLRYNHNEAVVMAAEHGHLEIVKYLVEHGANVRDQHNQAIVNASCEGHLEVVKYLISVGANPIDKRNNSIAMAANHGHLEVVKYLLPIFQKNTTDFQIRINDALIWSCMVGNLSIIKYLVQSGADPTTAGNTPIEYASEGGGDLEVLKYLISVGADWRQCKTEDIKILKAEQLRQLRYRKCFRHISKNLIPVYYSPSYTGGILAKKDLEHFTTKLLQS